MRLTHYVSQCSVQLTYNETCTFKISPSAPHASLYEGVDLSGCGRGRLCNYYNKNNNVLFFEFLIVSQNVFPCFKISVSRCCMKSNLVYFKIKATY